MLPSTLSQLHLKHQPSPVLGHLGRPLLAILRWRQAHDATKTASEMGVIEESEFHGQGGHGFLRLGQTTAASLNPNTQQVLPRRGAKDAAEAAVKLALG